MIGKLSKAADDMKIFIRTVEYGAAKSGTGGKDIPIEYTHACSTYPL